MRLVDWRIEQEWSQARLADELGCVLATVARYEGGTRRPEEPLLEKIFVLTAGRVTPNDFYPLAKWRLLIRTVAAVFQRDAA